MKGIDVSKHQGKIDWQKVKAAGIEFAIIRAGYGMYENQVDPYFKANMEGAKAVGIPVGIFWYSYATSRAEAEQEAAVCLKIIEPYRDQIVLPVFFDQEYEPGILAQSKTVRTVMCRTFMEAVKDAGYRAGLYCSLDWYENKVDASPLMEYPVWIAQYDVEECTGDYFNLICWQHTSKGRVDGINGNVDLDIGYNGLLQEQRGAGWVQTLSNWYYYQDGAPVVNRWIKDSGWWYYLGADGKMLTGYQRINGKLYYLNESRYEKDGIVIPMGACPITDDSGAISL